MEQHMDVCIRRDKSLSKILKRGEIEKVECRKEAELWRYYSAVNSDERWQFENKKKKRRYDTAPKKEADDKTTMIR